MARPEHIAYYKNGRPFTDFLNQSKHDTSKEPTSRPDYYNNAVNQSTPQTLSKEAPNMGMKIGMYPEPRREDLGMSSRQVAEQSNTVGSNSNSISNHQQLKMNGPKRIRFRKLLDIGVPHEQAIELCEMQWDVLEQLPFVRGLQRRATSARRQGSNALKQIQRLPQETDNSLVSSQGILGSLRVGIRNSVPMTEAQMKAVHHHLIVAITKQWADGGGPEFRGFFIKINWILVICANQRSKDWLVSEVPFLEPWPGVQLSIIPEKELPKPPRGLAFFPTSEAVSFQEALDLLKAQNKGLYTELWKLTSEKIEEEGRTVTFYIDECSVETLRVQDRQAALGFKMVPIQVKSTNRTYTGYGPTTQNRVPTSCQGNKDSSKRQGSQSCGAITQGGGGPLTSQDGTSATGGYPMPQVVEIKTHPSAGQTSFAQGSGPSVSRWDQPSTQAATGQMDLPRGMFGSQLTQDSQSFTMPFTQNKSQGETVILREPTSSARGPQVAWEGDGSWSSRHESQSKTTPLIQDRIGGDRTVFDQDMKAHTDGDKSAQASRGRNSFSREDSYDTGTAFAHNKNEGTGFTKAASEVRGGFGTQPIIIDSLSKKTSLIQVRIGGDRTVFDRDRRANTDGGKSAQESRGRNTFSRDDSCDTGTAFAHNKNEGTGFTKPASEVRGGFGTRPIILDSQSTETPLIQGRIGGDRTVFDQDKRATADRNKSGQASRGRNSFSRDDSYDAGTTFAHNKNEGIGFTKPASEVSGGFGTRPIILDSQSKKTPLIQSRIRGDRTVFDQDKRESADRDKSGEASRGRNTFSRDDSCDTGTAFAHNKNEGTGFTKPASEVRGGFGTRPIILDSQSTETPLIQGRIGGDRTVFDQDKRATADRNKSGQASRGRNSFSRDDSYDAGTTFAHNKNEGIGFTKPASEVSGGFGTRPIILDSQSKKTPLIQSRIRGDRTVFDQDKRESADRDKSGEASRGRNSFSRDDSYDAGTAFAHNKNEGICFTKPASEVRGGFGSRPIILDSQSTETPLIQGRIGGDRMVFNQDMRATADRDKSGQASRGHNSFSRDDSCDSGTAFAHNKNEGGFTKPASEVRGGFGTRPIILASQSKETPLIQGRIGGVRTVFDQDKRASADRDKSPQASRERNSFSRDDPSYDRDTGFSHNENVGKGFIKPTSQVKSGFGAPPIIQNSLSRMGPLTQSWNAGLNRSGQDGFSASAAKGSQACDLSAAFGQASMGGGDTESDWSGFSGQPQAKRGFGGGSIIRASQFGQDRNSDNGSDHASGLATNQVPRGEGSWPSMQDARSRRSGNIAQDTSGVDLTVVDMEESSGDEEQPEDEGGYSSWIIEDPETYGNRIIQAGAGITGTLTPASVVVSQPGWDVISQNHDMTQFTEDNRDGMESRGDRTSKSRAGLLPHPSGYADGIIEPKNHESSFPCSAGTGQSPRSGRGLLPHPKDSYGSLIQDESRGRPIQDIQTVIDEPRPSKGLLPHPSGNYGAGLQDSETQGSHGMSQGSKSRDEPKSDRGLLPHPRGYEARTQDPENRGRPFEDRKATGRESKDRRSSPQARGSYSARIEDSERYRRRSRSPRRMESRGSFQGRERSSRDLRSDRLSPQTSHGRLRQDSKKSNRWDGSASRPLHSRDKERSERGSKRPLDRQDSRDHQRGSMRRLDTRLR